MRKLTTSLLLAAALCGGLLTFPTGCKSPATAAYKVTTGTYYTVDAAMSAWGEYVYIYHPPAAQERQVAQAYKGWQTASVAVVDTAKAAQANDASAQARVNAAVAASAAALNGLISILGQFGINLVPK